MTDGPANPADSQSRPSYFIYTTTGEQSKTSYFVYITSTVAALASAATLAATVYGLIFLVRPNLKPPEKLGASISKILIEERVTYGQYVARSGAARRSDLAEDQLGALLYIKVDIQGFHERHYGTFLTLVDAKTKRPLLRYPNGKYHKWASIRYQPAVSSDKTTLYAWISGPRKKGKYFVRVRLYDQGLAEGNPSRIREEPTRGMLDVVDSKTFTW